jgi:CubicO group peptidase (beta-lactamase class C family)
MMLYEQGKLSLDDSVSMYLPVFKNLKVLNKFNEADSTFTTVETKRPVTIRDLLTHTSGIGYPGIDGKEMNALYAKYGVISGIDPKLTLEDEMGKLAQVPLGFQPGEKWNYGLSVDVLGYLVESISGMRLDKFFKKYIFEPLGMKDTYFYLPEVKYDRLMELYDVDSKHHLVRVQKSEAFDPEYPKANGHYFSGGGGLSSTAYDYALFLQMLLNGGNLNGKRLLSQNTVRMMTTNQIGDLFCQGLFLGRDKFGLGFEIISPPDSLKFPIPSGSYGWGGTFGSLYWIDPVNKIVAQLVLQVVNPDNYREVRNKFVTLVYEALVK